MLDDLSYSQPLAWHHAPSRQLVAAVLELAIDDLQQATAGEPLRGNTEHQLPDREGSLPNTVRWFESNDSTRPFSFRWCCKALALDADGILSRLHTRGLPV